MCLLQRIVEYQPLKLHILYPYYYLGFFFYVLWHSGAFIHSKSLFTSICRKTITTARKPWSKTQSWENWDWVLEWGRFRPHPRPGQKIWPWLLVSWLLLLGWPMQKLSSSITTTLNWPRFCNRFTTGQCLHLYYLAYTTNKCSTLNWMLRGKMPQPGTMDSMRNSEESSLRVRLNRS